MNYKRLGALLVLVPSGLLWAADPATAQFYGQSVLAACLAIGIAAAGCGIAMGMFFAATVNAMARQPELSSKLQTTMFIGFAMIEAQVLYALFIVLLLFFSNPFTKLLV